MRLKLMMFFIVVFIVFIIGFVFALKHERSVVRNACSRYASELFASSRKMKALGIGAESKQISSFPKDVNIYGRFANCWFDIPPKGYLLIEIELQRGIGDLPLFNTFSSVKVVNMKFNKLK